MTVTGSANIILLMTDQQRFDTVAALGNSIIRTPALDRLCREGMAFTRCYTPCPVCAPARAALASGLAPHRTGLTDNESAGNFVPPTSLMQRLVKCGYQTHGVGKMHFVPDPQNRWGFESRDRSEEGVTDPTEDDFVTFIRNNGYGHVDDQIGRAHV